MTGIRVILLCLAAAFVCMAIRSVHPQIASAVALAAGMAAVMLSAADIASLSQTLREIESVFGGFDGETAQLMKLCGLVLLAELAADICEDSGEKALANRIGAGVRISVAAAALPVAGRIVKLLAELPL